LPWVSTSRIGEVVRPTSRRRLGADIADLQVNLHAVCFGFATQP
jgi:hypothetical protein